MALNQDVKYLLKGTVLESHTQYALCIQDTAGQEIDIQCLSLSRANQLMAELHECGCVHLPSEVL